DCVSSDKIVLTVVPPPSIADVMPVAVCDAQADQTVILDGTGFLKVGTELPTVTIGGMAFTPTAASGCTKVDGMFTEGDVETCTSLTVVVPKGTFIMATYNISITNPKPTDSTTTEMVSLTVHDPPQVSSVVPAV